MPEEGLPGGQNLATNLAKRGAKIRVNSLVETLCTDFSKLDFNTSVASSNAGTAGLIKLFPVSISGEPSEPCQGRPNGCILSWLRIEHRAG